MALSHFHHVFGPNHPYHPHLHQRNARIASTTRTPSLPPVWPRYFYPSCPFCISSTPSIQPTRSQIFTCTAVPTPTQPWLIHRSSPLRYQPDLNPHASSFSPGAKNHTTNIEHLSKILGEIHTIELNIELGYRHLELERVVRDMDAQLRGVEDCGMLDMVAMGADRPPVRGFIWFPRKGRAGGGSSVG